MSGPLGRRPEAAGLPFDLWSSDQGRTLGEFPDLAHALAAVRRACADGPAELVLSHEERGRRAAIAVGAEVLTLARVPGGPWTESRFATARRQAAHEAVRQASSAFVTTGSPEARRRLDEASRRLLRLGPPDQDT